MKFIFTVLVSLLFASACGGASEPEPTQQQPSPPDLFADSDDGLSDDDSDDGSDDDSGGDDEIRDDDEARDDDDTADIDDDDNSGGGAQDDDVSADDVTGDDTADDDSGPAGDDDSGGGQPGDPGFEGGPCYDNGTCSFKFVCRNGFCVNKDDATEIPDQVSGEVTVSPSLPPLTVGDEVCFDDAGAATPNIFAYEGTLYAFYTRYIAGDEYHMSELMVRRADAATLTLSDPVKLIDNAFQVDFAAAGGTLWAIAAGGYVSNTLWRSDDGLNWNLAHAFPASNGAVCQYRVPSYFARPLGGALALALGYDYNDGLFGCHHQTFWTTQEDTTWTDPVLVGNGTPAGAFVAGANIDVPTSRDYYRSTDGGTKFEVVGRTDLTRDVLGGNDLEIADNGTLLLAYTYDTDAGHYVALHVSYDGAINWPGRYLLAHTAPADGQFYDPRIAVAGETYVVGWEASEPIAGNDWATRGVVALSPDAGKTWTSGARVGPQDDSLLGFSIAVSGDDIFAFWTNYGGEYPDYPNRHTCLTRLKR